MSLLPRIHITLDRRFEPLETKPYIEFNFR
jgi:hypothetical protein